MEQAEAYHAVDKDATSLKQGNTVGIGRVTARKGQAEQSSKDDLLKRDERTFREAEESSECISLNNKGSSAGMLEERGRGHAKSCVG